jgi:small subunit ribosomal protein S17e
LGTKETSEEIPTRPIRARKLLKQCPQGKQGESMGRVKSIAIKTLGDDIIEEHSKKLSADFDTNKKVLADITVIKSKRTRNVLAGYISNKIKAMRKAS